MDQSMVIALVLIAVIAIILIMSVTHISAKCGEMATYLKRLVELKEKENKE